MRTGIELQVVGTLEDLRADFEAFDIDPDFADTAAFCAKYGFSLDESANAILVASKQTPGIHSLCLNLATTRLDVNHTVRELMGVKKLSFASADLTREVTGMEIGGVTPFGVPPGLPIYVDAAVVTLSRCIVGGGSRAMKVKVNPEVFRRLPGATIVDGLTG